MNIHLYVLMSCSDGAANLNDMKEMLASLPQYQEQREKVIIIKLIVMMSDSDISSSFLYI